jgi:hypothetical protein
MQRALPWLTAVFFISTVVLGYMVVREKMMITQVSLDWGTADKDSQKRIADLQHRLAAAKEAEVLAAKQAAQAARAASASSGSGGGSSNGGARIVHIGDILKDHPEYSALYAKQIRRNVDRMYGNGLSTLNLPPEQLAQLKDLLVEREMSNIDAQGAAQAEGLVRGSPEWQDAMKQASQDTEAQITAILGSNADSTLIQLQTRAGFQTQVDFNLASDYADAGAPLTPDQSNGLVQAMADANYAGKDTSTRPANYNVVDPATGLSPHDDRIINGAAQVLNPTQLQVLKTDQIQGEQQRAIMQEYNAGGGQVMFVP